MQIGTVKSDDDGDASASEKEMDDLGEACPLKRPVKGKRKLQTRKGSKLLQLQAKTASDSESDTGTKKKMVLKLGDRCAMNSYVCRFD